MKKPLSEEQWCITAADSPSPPLLQKTVPLYFSKVKHIYIYCNVVSVINSVVPGAFIGASCLALTVPVKEIRWNAGTSILQGTRVSVGDGCPFHPVVGRHTPAFLHARLYIHIHTYIYICRPGLCRAIPPLWPHLILRQVWKKGTRGLEPLILFCTAYGAGRAELYQQYLLQFVATFITQWLQWVVKFYCPSYIPPGNLVFTIDYLSFVSMAISSTKRGSNVKTFEWRNLFSTFTLAIAPCSLFWAFTPHCIARSICSEWYCL